MKHMKKILLAISFCILAAFSFTSCFNEKTADYSDYAGRYYCYIGNYKTDVWIDLKANAKWENSTSSVGPYTIKDKDITLFIEVSRKKEEFMSGTINNGVMNLTIVGGGTSVLIYKMDGATGSDNNHPGKIAVTFDSLGGSDVPIVYVDKGDKISQPADPIRLGYTFVGWYTLPYDFTNDNKWVFFGYTVTENMILYAKWEIIYYTISYSNLSGAYNPNYYSSYTVESDTIVFDAPSSQNGYTGSWNPASIPHGSTGNQIIRAVWTPIQYTISFTNLLGGQLADGTPTSYTIESDTILFAPPTRQGYTGSWNPSTIPSGSTGTKIITAVWTANQYAVVLHTGDTINATYVIEFNLNGASGTIATQTISETNSLTYPAIPTRSGYIFGGWYSNSGCTGTPFNFAAPITQSHILYAKWNPYSAAILPINMNSTLYALNYTSSISYYPFVPLVNQTVSIYTTNASYDVMLYLCDSDKSQLVVKDSGGNYDNESLTYAVTAGTLYYIGIKAYSNSGICALSLSGISTPAIGGNLYTSIIATYGESMPSGTIPTKAGYLFAGFYSQPNGEGIQYYDAKMQSMHNWDVANNAVLYAKWNAQYTLTLDNQGGTVGYNVNFNLNGGTESIPSQSTYLQGLTYPTPTRNGYIFAGWYTNAECTGNPFNFTVSVTQNNTLYAKWILPSNFAVTISMNNSVNVSYTTAVKYYPFVPLVTQSVTINTTNTIGDVMLYLYDSNKTQLTSKDSNGSSSNETFSYQVTAGSLYYIGVKGYNGSGSCTLNLSGTATPSAGGIIDGTITNKTYIVTQFSEMPAASAPKKTGYVFGGFYTLPNGEGVQYYDANMRAMRYWDLAQDTILYAKWTLI